MTRPTFSRVLCALPLTLIALLAPGSAPAATIAQAPDGALVVTGGAGATGLDLDVAADGRIRIAPTFGDPIGSVPPACEQAEDDPYLALCAVEPGPGLRVVLGDGNDRAFVQAPLGVAVSVDGGADADVLTGSIDGGSETLLGGTGDDTVNGRAGDDVVDGGDGGDTVRGGGGADRVLGGAGADTLSGDEDRAVDPDVIDGGDGSDTLAGEYSHVGREDRGPVSVTLGAGDDDGFAGERDDVRSVEKLETHTGGRYVGTDAGDRLYVGGEATTVEGRGGDDEIFTSYAADAIDGGAGADTIRGYGGDDRITGGPGADTLYGDTAGQVCNTLTCSIYSGNDVIDARDGERDSIDCGHGTDELLADAADVHANCEAVRVSAAAGAPGGDDAPRGGEKPRGGAGAGARVSVSRRPLGAALARGLVVRITGARPGRATVSARSGRSLVARGRATIAGNGSARVVLRFTTQGRRALRGKRRVSLQVTVAGAATIVQLAR